MPFSFAFHASPNRAAVRFDGPLTPLDVRDACHRLHTQPDWHPALPEVWDFSAVSSLHVDPDGWATLLTASLATSASPGTGSVAVVSQDDDFADLLSLYARAFRSSGRTFQLVPTHDAALDWLDERLAA